MKKKKKKELYAKNMKGKKNEFTNRKKTPTQIY